jgi:hypothetical protein
VLGCDGMIGVRFGHERSFYYRRTPVILLYFWENTWTHTTTTAPTNANMCIYTSETPPSFTSR